MQQVWKNLWNLQISTLACFRQQDAVDAWGHWRTRNKLLKTTSSGTSPTATMFPSRGRLLWLLCRNSKENVNETQINVRNGKSYWECDLSNIIKNLPWSASSPHPQPGYRFKDGLATLNLYNALEQHPSLFLPYLVYSAEDLKAETLEALFHPQMSPTGSSKCQEEERVLGYWLDYLITVKGIFWMLFKVAVV